MNFMVNNKKIFSIGWLKFLFGTLVVSFALSCVLLFFFRLFFLVIGYGDSGPEWMIIGQILLFWAGFIGSLVVGQVLYFKQAPRSEQK